MLLKLQLIIKKNNIIAVKFFISFYIWIYKYKCFALGGNWYNTGYGFENGDNISLGYDGSYLSLNTTLDGYINIPEGVLKGSSSGWGSQIQSQFNSYVGELNKWGTNTAMGIAGAMSLPTGSSGASVGSWAAIRGLLAGSLRAGLWSLPLILEGDTSRREQKMTLFRGVHAKHPALASAYNGMAIPMGGSATAKEHNFGDNNSMYTSWSTSIDVANYFASRRGPGGIILSNQFQYQDFLFLIDMLVNRKY
ncbi:hypothetical protein [Chryseobacterium gossypii]|uniref:hypothetical protein n=1 Tax=Chryseobacterium gossypii TaxID=3231602 RepID=UPI0035253BD0